LAATAGRAASDSRECARVRQRRDRGGQGREAGEAEPADAADDHVLRVADEGRRAAEVGKKK